MRINLTNSFYHTVVGVNTDHTLSNGEMFAFYESISVLFAEISVKSAAIRVGSFGVDRSFDTTSYYLTAFAK